jgi:hypothetical protein
MMENIILTFQLLGRMASRYTDDVWKGGVRIRKTYPSCSWQGSCFESKDSVTFSAEQLAPRLHLGVIAQPKFL